MPAPDVDDASSPPPACHHRLRPRLAPLGFVRPGGAALTAILEASIACQKRSQGHILDMRSFMRSTALQDPACEQRCRGCEKTFCLVNLMLGTPFSTQNWSPCKNCPWGGLHRSWSHVQKVTKGHTNPRDRKLRKARRASRLRSSFWAGLAAGVGGGGAVHREGCRGRHRVRTERTNARTVLKLSNGRFEVVLEGRTLEYRVLIRKV